MELLTRNNFESWMQKLMERLDRQDELLLSLQPSGQSPEPDRTYQDVRQPRPLYAAPDQQAHLANVTRSIGSVADKTLGKKTYYSDGGRADVLPDT